MDVTEEKLNSIIFEEFAIKDEELAHLVYERLNHDYPNVIVNSNIFQQLLNREWLNYSRRN